MRIHVSRNAAIIGIFTEDEARARLTSGQLLPTDHAWATGMSEWKPLSQWNLVTRPEVQATQVTIAKDEKNELGTKTPWEQDRGVGSAFKTIAGLITAPRETLARGTPTYWEIASMGWVTMLAMSPLYILADLVNADQQANVMRETGRGMLRSLSSSYDGFSVMIKKWAYVLASTQPKDLIDATQGVAMTLFLAPITSAIIGAFLWCALRTIGLFGHRECKGVDVWDAGKAYLLGMVTIWPFAWLLNMMPPGTGASLVVLMLYIIAGTYVNCRIIGASLRLGTWTVLGGFGIACILMFTAGFGTLLGLQFLMR